MRLVHSLLLVILLSSVGAVYLYPQSQEVTNALHEQRITQLERSVAVNTTDITYLASEIAGLRSSIDRFTGLGLGIGACLTGLQAILVIITFKRKS